MPYRVLCHDPRLPASIGVFADYDFATDALVEHALSNPLPDSEAEIEAGYPARYSIIFED
jgi:hypothetical protein